MIKSENILLENATQQTWKPVTSASPEGHSGDEFHFLISVTIKPPKDTIQKLKREEPSPQSCQSSSLLPYDTAKVCPQVKKLWGNNSQDMEAT